MTFAAARLIVFETSHHAQTGALDSAGIEVAENLVAEALAEASGRRPGAVATIARNLYWKLNPLGTVPPSFYKDSNFQKLTDRILGIVAPSGDGADPRSASAIEIHAFDDVVTPVADLNPIRWDSLKDGAFPRAEDEQNHVTQDALAFSAFDEMPSTTAPAEAGPYAPETLNAIRAVLVSFIGDLSDIITVRPEWKGREAEAVGAPARIAAERLAMILSKTSAAGRSPVSPVAGLVPTDWAKDAVAWLLERIEALTTIMWSDAFSREDAITTAAAKVAVLLQDMASRPPMQDNFGNSVSLADPQNWTRMAAGEVYQMLLDDDFKPYRIVIATPTRQEGVAYLQKSIFENVYPSLIFSLGAGPAEDLPQVGGQPKREIAQREAWKMPWSVARDIVDDLCSRSRDETAFLSLFKDWLGSSSATSDEIRQELISEVVARGREREIGTEDIDLSAQPSVSFVYQNWKGEVAVRSAVPVRMTFGSNEWHKDPQWLMEAFDLKHKAPRTFALSGIIRFMEVA